MDVQVTLHNITFEWDSAKAEINARKHNAHFEAAYEVFFDPFLHYLEDELVNGVTIQPSF